MPTTLQFPTRAVRHARIVADVQALLDKAVPLPFALSTVQCIENQATYGMDCEYGPFTDVARVWELHEQRLAHGEAAARARAKFGHCSIEAFNRAKPFEER